MLWQSTQQYTYYGEGSPVLADAEGIRRHLEATQFAYDINRDDDEAVRLYDEALNKVEIPMTRL